MDKPRWAAKLVTLEAERETNKSLLRSLQKPEVRNQNVAAQVKRLEAELAKNRRLHKTKWVAVDESREQIAEYEDEAEALCEKIEKRGGKACTQLLGTEAGARSH